MNSVRKKVLLLGGTSEAARAATVLAGAGWGVLVSTATDNEQEIGNHPAIVRRSGRLDAAGLRNLIHAEHIVALVDVSHPYAAALHAEAARAAEAAGIPYIYYERPPALLPADQALIVADHEAAAEAAFGTGHPVLLTVGARHIACYGREAARTGIRAVARVLDDPASLAACRAAGFPEDAIITGRGPFSVEQNRALIRRFDIGVLVTKDGGEAGGFPAKQKAARQESCRLVVVRRPARPNGQVCHAIEELPRILANGLTYPHTHTPTHLHENGPSNRVREDDREYEATDDPTPAHLASGLILLAHGSKNSDWQRPFEQLAAELRAASDTISIRSVYLQMASPDLAEAVREMTAEGIRHIDILPMFMAPGNHIREDIPHEVGAVEKEHPGLRIRVLPPIGNHPRFKAMMKELVRELL